MPVPNPECCSDPRYLCRDCRRTNNANLLVEDDGDDETPSILSRLGLDETEDDAEDETDDSELLVPPTMNWAEIREEERRGRDQTVNQRDRPTRGRIEQPDDDELLIPPRIVW